jgi:hypothetical protein
VGAGVPPRPQARRSPPRLRRHPHLAPPRRAVEDAGFEIRDSIAWLYGSGFPKSLDVSKAIDKALDMFAGTGTTGEACALEEFRCILMEREPDYLPLIEKRLHKPVQTGFDFGEPA